MPPLIAPVCVIIRSCELVNSASYLEQDLDCSVDHAHPPAQEGEEREDELDEVVGQRLEAMKPPRGAMHVVGHGVRNWLGLGPVGGAERRKCETLKILKSAMMTEIVLCGSECVRKEGFVKIIMIFNQ